MTDQSNASNDEQQLNESRQLWNAEAASFDNEPDHGPGNPVVLAARTDLLKRTLPPSKTDVLDIGCGTGSLSLVLMGLGYGVIPKTDHFCAGEAWSVQISFSSQTCLQLDRV